MKIRAEVLELHADRRIDEQRNGNIPSSSDTDDEVQHCAVHHGDQPCVVRPLLLGAVVSVEC